LFLQEIIKKSSSSSIAFSSESDGTEDDTEDGLEQVKINLLKKKLRRKRLIRCGLFAIREEHFN
jgi:hypothetical protein